MLTSFYNKKVNSFFYIYASLFVIAGWLWLLYNLNTQHGISVCLFNNLTGIPCPTCGTTTAIVQIINGDLTSAFNTNPLSYIIAVGLLVLATWVLKDIIGQKYSLQKSIARFDKRIKQTPWLLAIILSPVILSWIWILLNNR